jgi:hypothetical protein
LKLRKKYFWRRRAKPRESSITRATSVFNLSEQLRNDRADDTLKAIIAIEESTYGHPHRPSARSEKRHRSREFVEFLKRLDTAYALATAIKIILDRHSAHISN